MHFITFIYLTLLCSIWYQNSSACSSRTVPKPRPNTAASSSSISGNFPVTAASITTPTVMPYITTTRAALMTTTPRPNITFPTYKCPETFDAWYCLNDATCFAVKIGELPVYSCECANGFMGQRCEYKEIDGSYMPKRPRPLLEKASIASGAICALLFMLIVCLTLYLRYEHKENAMALYESLKNQQRNLTAKSDCCCSCCSCDGHYERYCCYCCCASHCMVDTKNHMITSEIRDERWLINARQRLVEQKLIDPTFGKRSNKI